MVEPKGRPQALEVDPSGQRILLLAAKEATRLNHAYIGTEHILLAFVAATSHEDYKGENVLEIVDLNPQVLKGSIEMLVTKGESEPQRPASFTERARKVVESAIDEARREGSITITPRHLFIGLLLEGQGYAAGVIEYNGVSLETAREKFRPITSPAIDKSIANQAKKES